VRPGQHAASDGSFGRSAGIQVGRAVALVAVAVVVGVILLRHNKTPSGATTVAARPTTTTVHNTHPSTTAATQPGATTPLRAPATVKVLVANGTVASGGGSTHLAGTVSTKLKGLGYNTLAAVNATQGVTASIVMFQPGYDKEAAALAQALGLPATAVQPLPTTPPVSSLFAANILVVAGPDLAQSTGSTTPSTAATTPTTSRTTTTIHR
jgi:hypothetical protein